MRPCFASLLRLGAALCAAAIVVAAGAAAKARPATPLAPFFATLEALHTGAATGPVVIMQIGDSHTAADLLSGRLRQLFQQRFGAAGRGMLPPGIPEPWYAPDLVQVSQAGGWQLAGSIKGPGPFGLGGVAQNSTGPGAQMVLTETEPAGFDRAFVEVLRRPGGGTLRLRVDNGTAHDFATAANTEAAQWIDLPAAPKSHVVALSTLGSGPVTLLSWGTQRRVPGIVYENLGIIGATVAVIGNWNPATVALEMQHRDPALIVVAYGTNMAAAPAAALAWYKQAFATRVKELSAAAPHAAVLVIGPPDMNLKGQPPVAGCTAADEGWAPPPGLALVREAQREVAQQNGWYFWDWQAAMGGPCASDRWFRQNPPLALPDHIHQTPAGYQRSADALFATLMAEYRHYRARPGAPHARR